jgi:hypothetical protein
MDLVDVFKVSFKLETDKIKKHVAEKLHVFFVQPIRLYKKPHAMRVRIEKEIAL